jgi:hypothetical protein
MVPATSHNKTSITSAISQSEGSTPSKSESQDISMTVDESPSHAPPKLSFMQRMRNAFRPKHRVSLIVNMPISKFPSLQAVETKPAHQK